MRVVALSDHAGDMLADARRRRAAAEGRAEERYRRELAAYRRRAGEARDRRARARGERGLLSRLSAQPGRAMATARGTAAPAVAEPAPDPR